MKKVISVPGAPSPVGPYSHAVQANNMVFTSGQIPMDAAGNIVEGGIDAQTRQVMQNIGNVLQAAGLDFSHIVKSSIFLADMNDFAVVNEIYASYFTSDFPARETVQVARLPKDARIEISVIALRD
jgi:2-iminobutanoate/2-iminopropanoate deaminase